MSDSGGRLRGVRVAVLLEDGFEDLEFWVPVMRLREEGAVVRVVGTEAEVTARGKHCLTASSDVAAGSVSAEDFDAVVVPGGWAPDKMRRHTAMTELVSRAHSEGKIIGLICHAGLVGISAGIVKARGPPEALASRTISLMQAPSGSIGRRSEMATSCGGAWWMTSPTSAGSWSWR